MRDLLKWRRGSQSENKGIRGIELERRVKEGIGGSFKGNRGHEKAKRRTQRT